MGEKSNPDGFTRRSFIGKTSTILTVAATSSPILAAAQQTIDKSGDNHTGVNERQPGPRNPTLDQAEPDSVYPPITDAGGQPPFKYPFSFAHKRIEAGGWTRQVTVRDFVLSKKWRALRCGSSREEFVSCTGMWARSGPL
jgi:oxalate decarboxylase